jgi:hypothetical protein
MNVTRVGHEKQEADLATVYKESRRTETLQDGTSMREAKPCRTERRFGTETVANPARPPLVLAQTGRGLQVGHALTRASPAHSPRCVLGSVQDLYAET